ncbi:pilus assembly protein PilV [Ramlibacter sp. PS3R-8]|uniref:type IV pilus modification PilV family protein n=1 Tax=Ramlibacter sp. PS3R-8 TaxID=3133437 RepID=UPI0030B1DB2E
MNKKPHISRKPAARRQRGVALVEALVGILIFAFGIIGLVGLQVAMTRAQGSAKYRADAAYLSSQVLGNMWADRANLASYNTGAACDAHAPCSDFVQKVESGLPAGAVEISATAATGVVSMTLTWSTSAEGTHSHVVSSSIN